MTRSRTKLDPWIENLITSHGTEKELNSANLKARVVAVGKMSHSQALVIQGPPELLFISDGVVQIPAVLTDTAWEHLQEDEDRESFSSLVNTTVCLQTYSLQFHMTTEKRRSKFFLSLGKLATMAAGPVKECPPCCTTLSSVRVKICDTWTALQHQNSPQAEFSQSGIDLSELLGVWQYDCFMDLAEEVRLRLTAARGSASPQPSTSRDPPGRPLGAHLRTAWDIDRVRCKGAKPFSIPMAHLVIPDTAPRSQPVDASATPSGLVVYPMGGQSAEPQGAAREPFLEVNRAALSEEMDQGHVSDPWTAFSGASKVFSSSLSYDTSPRSQALTSTQVPSGGLEHDVSPTVTGSTGDQSFLPPYQNPVPMHASPHTPPSSESSPPDCAARADPNAAQSSGERTPGLLEKDPSDASGEAVPTTSGAGVKRKRREHHHHHPSTVAGPEQEGAPCVDLSPPSWLFESQTGPLPEAGRGSQQARVANGGVSYPAAVHSDGSRFSYHYKVCLKNVQDLSGFKVAGDHLHWAVKYLVVPKEADDDDNRNIS
ncbi:hypothetical protein NHX12_002926 [Muraenolepis orangiensis]|uniref:Shelterin complex subunit TPP1/Est3 domain-containing protein n=1 Tax=Muraenolepis orangiensis TaxID=630683 RepID=A0A9Q0DXZ8_9TELE|nr:hypothetical protein NHX12_002926 [Muraenolepis orangiensis]